MSRRRTAAGPPPLPTGVSDYTSVPRALLALHLDYEHLTHAGTRADRAARLWEHHHPDGEQSSDPPSSEDDQPSSEDEQTSSEDAAPTSGDDSSASSSRYFLGSGPAPRSRHRRRRRENTPSPSPPSSSSSASSESSRSRSPVTRRRRTTHHSHRHRQHRRRHHSHARRSVPISRSLREKIVRGEFIDFPELLGELTVVGTAGAHSRAQKCRVAPIASLPSWLQAWGTFAEVLSGVSPPHLWRYQSFIVRSSQRFKEHAWLQYDLFFRRKMALDPSLSWSAIDTELVASCLSADTIRSQLACFACGESSHLAPGRQAALPDALHMQGTRPLCQSLPSCT